MEAAGLNIHGRGALLGRRGGISSRMFLCLALAAGVATPATSGATERPAKRAKSKKPKRAPSAQPAPPQEPKTQAVGAGEAGDAPKRSPGEGDAGPVWETEDDERAREEAARAADQARAAEALRLAEVAERAAVEDQARFRRSMMTVHQGLGIATWFALAGTSVVGQLHLNDKYGAGNPNNPNRFERLHLGLAIGSTALFAAGGLLGLLAPRPFDPKRGFSTITLHRILMGIATLGMAAQIGMGLFAHRLEGSLDQRGIVQAHQILGYSTLGAFTLGAVVLLF